MYVFKNSINTNVTDVEKVTHRTKIYNKILIPILKITNNEFTNIRKERDYLFINNKAHKIKDSTLKDVVDILQSYGISSTVTNDTKYLNIPSSFIFDFNSTYSTVIPLVKSPFDISTLPFTNETIKVLSKVNVYKTFNKNEEVTNRLEGDLLYSEVSENTSLIIVENATEYFIFLNLSDLPNYDNGHLNNSKIDNIKSINNYHYSAWSLL